LFTFADKFLFMPRGQVMMLRKPLEHKSKWVGWAYGICLTFRSEKTHKDCEFDSC